MHIVAVSQAATAALHVRDVGAVLAWALSLALGALAVWVVVGTVVTFFRDEEFRSGALFYLSIVLLFKIGGLAW
jgi:hypothetical protein